MKTDITTISRKSLLYKTKVEYGDWTINHITGCMHGCKFPCYAMMMAKKFGWVKNYEDWRKPKIVSNALELLEKEIPKYKSQIDFVHLCFMSDPFMYDFENKELVPGIKELTLQIIEKLNKEGIRVTTLTKGIYPEEILDRQRFLQGNEYGITLVSLNNDFKKEYEPYAANYEDRINSLKMLSQAGLKTWVSMEPYPTPALDETASNIDNIFEKIEFVNKIIFGKLNYNKIAKNSDDFYNEMSAKVIAFCNKHNIKYHIKRGTSLNTCNTINIF
jgi:DNA repair photolyase